MEEGELSSGPGEHGVGDCDACRSPPARAAGRQFTTKLVVALEVVPATVARLVTW